MFDIVINAISVGIGTGIGVALGNAIYNHFHNKTKDKLKTLKELGLKLKDGYYENINAD